jgi:c-di-GMP-binding flagellar brake protein YcgR
MTPSDEKNLFRRKYPRRLLKRLVGVIRNGVYSVVETMEIGEGGMALISKEPLAQAQQVVVSFQIPGGDFVSLRGVVRSAKNENGRFIHGLSFENIAFTHKRQIRSFVSARSSDEEVST